MRSEKIVVYNARNVKMQKHPQKKTRVSGVQLAACQASSFERFSQMNADKNTVIGGGAGDIHTSHFILEFL